VQFSDGRVEDYRVTVDGECRAFARGADRLEHCLSAAANIELVLRRRHEDRLARVRLVIRLFRGCLHLCLQRGDRCRFLRRGLAQRACFVAGARCDHPIDLRHAVETLRIANIDGLSGDGEARQSECEYE